MTHNGNKVDIFPYNCLLKSFIGIPIFLLAFPHTELGEPVLAIFFFFFFGGGGGGWEVVKKHQNESFKFDVLAP